MFRIRKWKETENGCVVFRGWGSKGEGMTTTGHRVSFSFFPWLPWDLAVA